VVLTIAMAFHWRQGTVGMHISMDSSVAAVKEGEQRHRRSADGPDLAGLTNRRSPQGLSGQRVRRKTDTRVVRSRPSPSARSSRRTRRRDSKDRFGHRPDVPHDAAILVRYEFARIGCLYLLLRRLRAPDSPGKTDRTGRAWEVGRHHGLICRVSGTAVLSALAFIEV